MTDLSYTFFFIRYIFRFTFENFLNTENNGNLNPKRNLNVLQENVPKKLKCQGIIMTKSM